MLIIPAIDIIGGQTVRLRQGDFNRQSNYACNPAQLAADYAGGGAGLLHLVDLDAAKGSGDNRALIGEIATTLPLPVQSGGGIRTGEDLQAALSRGIQRAVVGSVCVTRPQAFIRWLQQYGPDRLVAALDVRAGDDGDFYPATHGWLDTADQTLDQTLQPLLQAGLKHLLCTDISKDGMLRGSNLDLYRRLRSDYPALTIQASGGVSSLQDLIQLQATGVDAVIVGKALLEGRFSLPQAVAAAA